MIQRLEKIARVTERSLEKCGETAPGPGSCKPSPLTSGGGAVRYAPASLRTGPAAVWPRTEGGRVFFRNMFRSLEIHRQNQVMALGVQYRRLEGVATIWVCRERSRRGMCVYVALTGWGRYTKHMSCVPGSVEAASHFDSWLFRGCVE